MWPVKVFYSVIGSEKEEQHFEVLKKSLPYQYYSLFKTYKITSSNLRIPLNISAKMLGKELKFSFSLAHTLSLHLINEQL